MSDSKIKKIDSQYAPKAIGPYSQAVCSGNLLFVSGQIPLDPSTGNIVDGPIEEQMRLIMQNIGEILKAAGADLANVVKAEIYLTDIGDFLKVNEVYSGFFPKETKPARVVVEVSALPKSAKIEVSVVAVMP